MSVSSSSPMPMAAGGSPNRARLESTGWKSTSACESAQADMFTGIITDIGRVVAVEQRGDLRLRIACGYDIAGKGSIAVDGASLTVNEVDGARFGLNIIPHTAAETTLGDLVPGRRVNLEIDILARYIGRMLEMRG